MDVMIGKITKIKRTREVQTQGGGSLHQRFGVASPAAGPVQDLYYKQPFRVVLSRARASGPFRPGPLRGLSGVGSHPGPPWVLGFGFGFRFLSAQNPVLGSGRLLCFAFRPSGLPCRGSALSSWRRFVRAGGVSAFRPVAFAGH